MSNEDVINEIEDEIKKVKGEPEDFQIEITDDPVEEVKDIVEEERQRVKTKKRIMDLKFKRGLRNLLISEDRLRSKLNKSKSKMPNLMQGLLDLNRDLLKTARRRLTNAMLKLRLL